MNLLLFLLIGFGVTTIITKSTLFEPLRNHLDNGGESIKDNFLGFLIVCPMCVGFWVGVFWSQSFYSPTWYLTGDNYNLTSFLPFLVYLKDYILTLLADGCLVAGFSWALHEILALIDKVYDSLENKDNYMLYKLKSDQENSMKKVLND